MKKKGYNGHIGLWREKPYKKLGGKRQKILIGALTDRIERESVWKLFEKVIEHVRIKCFKNYLYDFWLIENKVQLIETHRTNQEILIAILINKKTDSIDRNTQSQAKIFWKTNFEKQSKIL